MDYEPLQEELFKRSFGGSVNIKGIDFQILYAIYYALDLCEPNSNLDKITLEGIEDIDLKPFQANNVYVQVKTSSIPWHLTDLVAPLVNFVRLNNISSGPQNFELILNFQPKDSFITLFSKRNNAEIINKIFKLKEFKDSKISENQFLEALNNCELKFIKKADLLLKIKSKMVLFLNLQPNEADLILLSIAYQFINWSIERKSITKLDISSFIIEYNEKNERNKHFEAYGKGLIDRINWHKDSNLKDYYEGKKTRFGHIALGLDIIRTKWLIKISEIYSSANVCIIREASGQGKSSLAFRYCFDNWDKQYSFSIKIVDCLEHAEQISNYLISMCELGLPIYVLIDDINEERKYFQKVLENCAGFKIPFLITCRNDDFYKYSKVSSITMGHLVPTFDQIEAINIFNRLKSENKISLKTISAEWAYEKINSPKCLIEYIYLITQGQMLHERLLDQVHDMQKENKPQKIDFLRKVILADYCSSPINVNELIPIHFKYDYQQIIFELEGEYIYIEEDLIKGYHWVRSAHLVDILHQNYANCAITALQILPVIRASNIPDFLGIVSNIKGFKAETFIKEYYRFCGDLGLSEYVAVIKGIFQIGEYLFYNNNKAIFDEAFQKYNGGSIFILAAFFAPTKQVNLFDLFDDNENFKDLKLLSKSINNENRGFVFVRNFVEKNSFTFPFNLISEFESVCQIMDWSFWIKKDILNQSQLKYLVEDKKIFEFDLNILGLFSQSLYRVNPTLFFEWFKENKRKIISLLEKQLECTLKLSGKNVKLSYFKYIKGEDLNEATMKRLKVIRTVLPFCEKYQGRHLLSSTFSTIMSIAKNIKFDPSFMNVQAENLPFDSDVEKNKTFNRIIEENYTVKTWYEFEECYYNLRKNMLTYSQNLVKRLKGAKHDFGNNTAHHISEKILHSFKNMPAGIESKEIKALFDNSINCFNNYNNFLIMKDKYNLDNKDEFSKKMICINYNNFLRKLNKMQLYFREISNLVPNYFNFNGLIENENVVFKELKFLLIKNIPNSIEYWDMEITNE